MGRKSLSYFWLGLHWRIDLAYLCFFLFSASTFTFSEHVLYSFIMMSIYPLNSQENIRNVILRVAHRQAITPPALEMLRYCDQVENFYFVLSNSLKVAIKNFKNLMHFPLFKVKLFLSSQVLNVFL